MNEPPFPLKRLHLVFGETKLYVSMLRTMFIVVCGPQVGPVQYQNSLLVGGNMGNIKSYSRCLKYWHCTLQFVQGCKEESRHYWNWYRPGAMSLCTEILQKVVLMLTLCVPGLCSPYFVLKTSQNTFKPLSFWKLVLYCYTKSGRDCHQTNTGKCRLFADKCRLMPISADYLPISAD